MVLFLQRINSYRRQTNLVGVEAGEKAATGNYRTNWCGLGLKAGRMKTGTPPRVDWTFIGFICCYDSFKPGDVIPEKFFPIRTQRALV